MSQRASSKSLQQVEEGAINKTAPEYRLRACCVSTVVDSECHSNVSFRRSHTLRQTLFPHVGGKPHRGAGAAHSVFWVAKTVGISAFFAAGPLGCFGAACMRHHLVCRQRGRGRLPPQSLRTLLRTPELQACGQHCLSFPR